MIVYLEIDESGIDKQKLMEELRSKMADLVKSKEFPELHGIIVKSELLCSDPYIPPR